MRLFIAIDVSQDLRYKIFRIQTALKKTRPDVKWVSPDTMHVTVKFLGEVPEDKVEGINNALEAIAAKTEPFDFNSSSVGVFPNWDFAKVLWLGIGDGAERLVQLAEDVQESLVNEGFPQDERKFSPHITIGRIRSARSKEKFEKEAKALLLKSVTSNVSKIILFKSTLTPKGPIHNIVAEHKFQI